MAASRYEKNKRSKASLVTARGACLLVKGSLTLLFNVYNYYGKYFGQLFCSATDEAEPLDIGFQAEIRKPGDLIQIIRGFGLYEAIYFTTSNVMKKH